MPNKKSQLEDLFPLLILMVFLLFAFIFASCTNQTRANQINEDASFQALSKDSTQLLINFLKSHITLDDIGDSDIGEAINIYFLNEDEELLEQIKAKAKEFFSTRYLENEDTFWSLEIEYPTGDTLRFDSDSATIDYTTKRTISTITLPTNNLDETIEIKLFIFYTKFIG